MDKTSAWSLHGLPVMAAVGLLDPKRGSNLSTLSLDLYKNKAGAAHENAAVASRSDRDLGCAWLQLPWGVLAAVLVQHTADASSTWWGFRLCLAAAVIILVLPKLKFMTHLAKNWNWNGQFLFIYLNLINVNGVFALKSMGRDFCIKVNRTWFCIEVNGMQFLHSSQWDPILHWSEKDTILHWGQ